MVSDACACRQAEYFVENKAAFIHTRSYLLTMDTDMVHTHTRWLLGLGYVMVGDSCRALYVIVRREEREWRHGDSLFVTYTRFVLNKRYLIA